MSLKSRKRTFSNAMVFSFRSSRFSSLILLFVALSLFFVSASRPDNVNGWRVSVTDFFSPVITVVNTPIEGAASYIRTLTGLAQLQEDNQRLRAENERLKEWYIKAQALEMENKSLETLLNYDADQIERYISARIIADTSNAYFKTILVKGGGNKGILSGSAVISGKGLLGRVIDVGKTVSRVLLLNDINSRVPVVIGGEGHKAILTGTNQNNPVIEHLSRDINLSDGQMVFTSGDGGVFPYGLPVGAIKRIGDGQWGVILNSNLRDTSHVSIVRPAEVLNDDF